MRLTIFGVFFVGAFFRSLDAKPAHDQERVQLEDLIITPKQKEFYEEKDNNRVRRDALKDRWLWPWGVVYYTFDKHLNQAGRNLALKAMTHWHYKTNGCIKFKRRSNPYKERFYAEFKYGGDCRAQIGFARRQRQLISIGSKQNPCALGSTIHEIGHALGFFHEHSRPDRDRYIHVLWNNMLPGKWVKNQFQKVNAKWVDYRGHKYDYKSIMHYSPWQGAKNRYSPVMKPKIRGATFGRRGGLSQGDINQIKAMYKCNGRGKSDLPDYVPSPGEDKENNEETEGPKPGDVEE